MTDYQLPTPANENCDPFTHADTALDELYRLRREAIALDTEGEPFERQRQRKNVLKTLDEAIELCLSRL